MKITRSVQIRVKPEVVWDVTTDLRNAKNWAIGFEDYPYISEDWPNAAGEAVWRYHAPLGAIDFKLKMIESVRGEVLRIDNSGPFGTGTELYRFHYADGVTTVDYETSSNPSLLGRLMMPLMRRKFLRQVDTTIANLKVYCEKQISL